MMRHKVIVAVLLTLLALGMANPADAQKKKTRKKVRKQELVVQAADESATPYSRREEKKRQRYERRKLKRERKRREEMATENSQQRTTTPPANNGSSFKYPTTILKPKYRVDVLASLYLDELVKKKSTSTKDIIPEKALPGVSLYEGVSIAVDSLKRAGYNIDIYVHDITTPGESIDTLLAKGSIDSADLILGAVQAEDIARVADYAKKKKINFVSTISHSDGGVKSNKYFTMLQPSLKSYCHWMVSDVSKKFPGMKVSLLYRTNATANEDAYKCITGEDRILFKQRQCNTLPTKQDLLTLFDTSKPNIVIIPLLEAGFADTLMKEISKDFPATHFEIYGMPTWAGIKGLRKEDAFPNLSINIPVSRNVDVNAPAAKYVARQYKEFFGGKPSESVFYAYETMIWYASLLKQYGTMFNPNYNDNTAAPYTRYEIKSLRDRDGHILYNENKHIMLSRFEGGAVRTE